MDEAVKLLISKLDQIDRRLKSIEDHSSPEEKVPVSVKTQPDTMQLDPLFKKTISLIESDDKDEFSVQYLQKQLNIDQKRTEKIMDQLVAAGYGTCYMGDVK